MKSYSKIVVLLALFMLVTLTACERAASQPPVVTPTGETGEVPFPVNTPDAVSVFATQTAVASTPLPVLPTETPEVVVATNTPEVVAQPDAAAATATTDTQAGGGVVQPAGPTPVVERPTTYALKKGEWPICIARRYDLDLGTFLSTNGMNMNSKPATGASLRIPASGNWSASQYGSRTLKAHPADYTVVAGDSVYSIACKYGDVTPEAILAVNNLTEAGITAGVKLRIP